jgi:hypothetical protein
MICSLFCTGCFIINIVLESLPDLLTFPCATAMSVDVEDSLNGSSQNATASSMPSGNTYIETCFNEIIFFVIETVTYIFPKTQRVQHCLDFFLTLAVVYHLVCFGVGDSLLCGTFQKAICQKTNELGRFDHHFPLHLHPHSVCFHKKLPDAVLQFLPCNATSALDFHRQVFPIFQTNSNDFRHSALNLDGTVDALLFHVDQRCHIRHTDVSCGSG